jgi:hypothetical protein
LRYKSPAEALDSLNTRHTNDNNNEAHKNGEQERNGEPSVHGPQRNTQPFKLNNKPNKKKSKIKANVFIYSKEPVMKQPVATGISMGFLSFQSFDSILFLYESQTIT